MRELLENTTPNMFVYIIKQLYHPLSSYMNSCTTLAHGLTVKYSLVQNMCSHEAKQNWLRVPG